MSAQPPPEPSVPRLKSEIHPHHAAHGANWAKWLAPFAGKPNVAGLELGVWKGEAAEWFLEHVLTHRTSRYVGVDTFEGGDDHRLAGIDCSRNENEARVRLGMFDGRALLRVGRTDEQLAELIEAPKAEFDFVYVDAAHDATSVLRDSVLAFELLKVGGVIIWDDFNWGAMLDDLDRPKIAIESFLECYARRIEVLGMGAQVAARKVA